MEAGYIILYILLIIFVGIPAAIFVLAFFGSGMQGGSRVKKATTAALNMDLIKNVYKKIKGNH